MRLALFIFLIGGGGSRPTGKGYLFQRLEDTKITPIDTSSDTTLVKALREHRKTQAEARLAGGETWQNEHNLACTTETGCFIRPRALGHLFRRRTKALGLDVTFHSLRHTHVSLLIKAGVPINVISSRVGHASPSITHNIYAHLLPGIGRDAAERFEGLLTNKGKQ